MLENFSKRDKAFIQSIDRYLQESNYGALSIQQKSPVQILEWNGSHPEFEVMQQGMLGETLLCLKVVDFFKLFAALEQHDCETISCTILYRNET